MTKQEWVTAGLFHIHTTHLFDAIYNEEKLLKIYIFLQALLDHNINLSPTLLKIYVDKYSDTILIDEISDFGGLGTST